MHDDSVANSPARGARGRRAALAPPATSRSLPAMPHPARPNGIALDTSGAGVGGLPVRGATGAAVLGWSAVAGLVDVRP
jgi:hypothetical protein